MILIRAFSDSGARGTRHEEGGRGSDRPDTQLGHDPPLERVQRAVAHIHLALDGTAGQPYRKKRQGLRFPG